MLYLFISLLLCGFAQAQKNMAIIIDGNDSSPDIQNLFKKSADESALYYLSQGYEVVRLNAANDKGARDLKKILSKQSNLQKLEIAIFSHGTVFNKSEFPEFIKGPDADLRFPVSYLRQDEVKTEYGPSVPKLEAVQFAFVLEKSSEKNAYNDWLGLGDLHESLAALKKQNPKLEMTLISNACFGGNAIRALQDIPDTQVFASASGSQKASAFQMINTGEVQKSVSYVDNFYKERERGRNILDASYQARKEYLKDKIEISYGIDSELKGLLVRPQNSFETLVADACLSSPKKVTVEPFCDKNFFEQPEVKAITAHAGKIIAQGYLLKEIEADDKYLELNQALLLCNKNHFLKAKKIFQSALKEAFNVSEKKFTTLDDCIKEPFSCRFNHESLAGANPETFRQLKEKCHLSKFKTNRLQQLECFTRNTKDDPFLRVLLFYDFNLSQVGPESELCGQFALAKSTNARLKNCLSGSNELNDDKAWVKLFSLYSQGLK